MLRLDPAYAEKAARISALARDITEYLATIDLPEPTVRPGLPSPIIRPARCSMARRSRASRRTARQGGLHGQGPARRPSLLRLGRHLQHHAARDRDRLRDRKVKNIEATGADVVATGNIGCITQIAGRAGMPIVHTVELLDWAYGGPRPNGL